VSKAEEDFYDHTPAVTALSQGDILEPVLCVDGLTGPIGVRRRVMVVSHSCEIDKKQSRSIYVAVYSRFEPHDKATLGAIRANRVIAAMFVPGLPGRIDTGFIDLRSIFRVAFESIQADRIDQGNLGMRWLRDPRIRVAKLAEPGKSLLQYSLSRYFGFERELATRDDSASRE
jgi:hypothetical protein